MSGPLIEAQAYMCNGSTYNMNKQRPETKEQELLLFKIKIASVLGDH